MTFPDAVNFIIELFGIASQVLVVFPLLIIPPTAGSSYCSDVSLMGTTRNHSSPPWTIASTPYWNLSTFSALPEANGWFSAANDVVLEASDTLQHCNQAMASFHGRAEELEIIRGPGGDIDRVFSQRLQDPV